MASILLTILAQETTKNTGSGGAVTLVFFALMIGAMYFFMIRPQRNRMRQHQDLLSSLGLGDEVETIGGIFGTIRSMDDEAFMIEVAPGTVVRCSRGAVRRKVFEPEEEAPSDSAT